MEESNTLTINEQVSISKAELQFKYATSSGPGGQHANRSNTKAILIFDIKNSFSLDEETRETLLQELSSRLDKHGVLRINVQDTRSQHQNREIAISRFVTLLAEALQEEKERIKTKPSKKARKKRKKLKKQQSQLKQDRQRDWGSEY